MDGWLEKLNTEHQTSFSDSFVQHVTVQNAVNLIAAVVFLLNSAFIEDAHTHVVLQWKNLSPYVNPDICVRDLSYS